MMSAKTLGRRLRQAREKMDVDLTQAAQATRIRRHYLEALENGEFELLPSSVQVRGFVRAYASFLNLNAAELLALLDPHPEPTPEEAAPEAVEPAVEQATQDIKEISPIEQTSFAAIGATLRSRRELLDLSYTEVAEQIHIPEHYLQYMEAGDFDRFPSPTQARGMLDNYAEFLGLEAGELQQPYADALQRRFQAQRPARPKLTLPKAGLDFSQLKLLKLPPWAKRAISPDLLVGTLFTLGLLVFFVWGMGRVSALRSQATIESTAPPLAQIGAASPTLPGAPTATLSPGEEGGVDAGVDAFPTEATPGEIVEDPGAATGVNLQLLASRRTWVRVTVDGQIAFEGRLAPQVPQSFSGQNEVLLYTGDAGSLQVFLNGENLGVVGVEGEVVSLLYTREGRATPTPSPTPTLDPNEPTLTPSATPQPTATEAVDAGG